MEYGSWQGWAVAARVALQYRAQLAATCMASVAACTAFEPGTDELAPETNALEPERVGLAVLAVG